MTLELIERVARRMHEAAAEWAAAAPGRRQPVMPWARMAESHREQYRHVARAVLKMIGR